MFTQLIIACTMFYCTTKTITPYVEYTENIASCQDGLHKRYYLHAIRYNKRTLKYTATVQEPGYDSYRITCDIIK